MLPTAKTLDKQITITKTKKAISRIKFFQAATGDAAKVKPKLAKRGKKKKALYLVEYEAGSNNDARLYTNLTKLAHNQKGFEKGCNTFIKETLTPGSPPPVTVVKAFWAAKNEDVKQRLLKLLMDYRRATKESFTITICTLKELLEDNTKEIVV